MNRRSLERFSLIALLLAATCGGPSAWGYGKEETEKWVSKLNQELAGAILFVNKAYDSQQIDPVKGTRGSVPYNAIWFAQSEDLKCGFEVTDSVRDRFINHLMHKSYEPWFFAGGEGNKAGGHSFRVTDVSSEEPWDDETDFNVRINVEKNDQFKSIICHGRNYRKGSRSAILRVLEKGQITLSNGTTILK